jgi:hypothetical protein
MDQDCEDLDSSQNESQSEVALKSRPEVEDLTAHSSRLFALAGMLPALRRRCRGLCTKISWKRLPSSAKKKRAALTILRKKELRGN